MSRTAWIVLALAFVLFPPSDLLRASDIAGRGQADLALRSATVLQRAEEERFCSGTFLSPILVLTAAHCLVSNPAFQVEDFQGHVYTIQSKRIDRAQDLALLTLKDYDGVARPAPLADSIGVGETIWLAGAPAGSPLMVSKGIVGRIDYSQFDNSKAPEALKDIGLITQQHLWMDVRSFYGASGGGVFNDQGQIVGVVVRLQILETAKLSMVLWTFAVGLEALKEFLR